MELDCWRKRALGLHTAQCGSRSADRSRYIDVINFNFQTPNVRDPTIERKRGARARARRRRDIAICVGFRRDPLRSCLRSRFSVPRSAGGRRRWTMRRRRVACIKLAEFQILRIANRRSRCITTVHADATDTRPAPRPLPTAVQGFSTTSNLPPKLISCTRTPTHTRTHAHSGKTARAHS